MYSVSTDAWEIIKQSGHEISKLKSFVLSGTITSVNLELPYAVKVMLEPFEIETGWIQLLSPYVGNGFGLVLPPPEEGAHVRVLFDMGDVNNGVVVGATYNDVTVPPNVSFGDAVLWHKSGSTITMKDDGSIVLAAKGGAAITLGTDQTVTIQGKTTQSW